MKSLREQLEKSERRHVALDEQVKSCILFSHSMQDDVRMADCFSVLYR